MTTDYAPKTLLRLYTTDNVYVCTAVVLRGGEVLEVKNTDGMPKKTYASCDEWKATRDPSFKLRVDDSSDPNGFIDKFGSTWTRWLLNTMYTGTPHLVSSPAVVTAFNNLTECLNTHRRYISMPLRIRTWQKYSADTFRLVHASFGGIPLYCRTPISKEQQETVRPEIANAATALYDLIYTDVSAYLVKMRKKQETEYTIKRHSREMKKYERRIQKLRHGLVGCERMLKKYSDEVDKLNESLKS